MDDHNVLDKGAIASLKRIEIDMAVVMDRTEKIPTLERAVDEIVRSTTILATAADSLRSTVENLPKLVHETCPHRDTIQATITRVNVIDRDVENLKRGDKNNNIFATVAAMISVLVGSALANLDKLAAWFK
jgi:hypothetical protein